jgi:hypothetical protein
LAALFSVFGQPLETAPNANIGAAGSSSRCANLLISAGRKPASTVSQNKTLRTVLAITRVLRGTGQNFWFNSVDFLSQL